MGFSATQSPPTIYGQNQQLMSNPSAAPYTSENASNWHAELTLYFKRTPRGSVLKHSKHHGPLYVQKAFYPEGRDVAHVYILHPPGGLVSGDNLQINIHAGHAAKVLLTTPGAGRVYKARSDKTLQQQQISIHAEKDSVIEWLPLETILYPNANTRLNTIVKLEENARFIGWDICCLGLPANGQDFEKGSLNQCLQIEISGRIHLRERIQLDDSNREIFSETIGFANRSVNALMVAGPFDTLALKDALDDLIDQIREYCASTAKISIDYYSHSSHSQDSLSTKKLVDKESPSNKKSYALPLCSVSMSGDFLLVRYLGDDSEQAREFFTQCWHNIRPTLLGKATCPPRIWAT